MAEFEKDFILRQSKGMASLLAKILNKEDVEQIMTMDQKETEKKKIEQKEEKNG